MKKCSFCGQELMPGTGKMFIKKDGKVLYFCSRTCEKHMLKYKRKASKQKWITKSLKNNAVEPNFSKRPLNPGLRTEVNQSPLTKKQEPKKA